MDAQTIFKVGMSQEDTFLVEEQHTAAHVGSGSMRVLATPWMIAFMEQVARKFMSEHLPEGYSSVGVRVDVRHLAPTPVGNRVRVHVEITAVEGSQVEFKVEAWEGEEKIGEGRHQRVAIDEARFLRRVAAKTDEQPGRAAGD